MKYSKDDFLEILSKCQGILYKVSLVYFKNKSDLEDNIQEIIYQLWKSFPTVKNQNSIGSWIYAVSINTSISRIKKASRIQYRDAVPELSDKTNIIDKISMDESLQMLLNAIRNLDEIDRSIMLLYMEEKSYDEISEIIGITKSQDDLIYLINNATLGIITMVSLISGFLSWHKIQSNRFNLPLKYWLDERIKLLTGWLTGIFSKLYLFLIPVLYILTVLSIHVYFEHKPFIEVLNTGESVIGLLVAAPIGLFVSYYVVKKIRKYQEDNLEFLKDMYGRLCSIP